MHDSLKARMGIAVANCETCTHLGSEGDGYEYNGTWLVCSKIDRMGFLKSFPFKKEMKCWRPNFWHSKFSEMIKAGTDEEMNESALAFKAALEDSAE